MLTRKSNDNQIKSGKKKEVNLKYKKPVELTNVSKY